MKILSGSELADKIKEEVKTHIAEKRLDVTLAVIQVGDNPASNTYVRNKEKACTYCGITSLVYKLPDDVSEEDLVEFVEMLNTTDKIDGILVQLPLPNHINEHRVIQTILPSKDVDGFHEVNVGKLMIGENTFTPCTAKGILELLNANNVPIEGQHCVVVGRSNIVGKPTAVELLRRNGTVTVCHSRTKDLKQICREADILVCAIGKPKFFNREYVSPKTTVIDVGIHRQEDGTLCGDVDFDDVKEIVSAITPVPKGVGAMTVAMLMDNCVKAAEMRDEK